MSVQISTLTAGSSNGQNTSSVPDLPSDLNIPSFGEPDAVSARATVSSERLWTFRTYLYDVLYVQNDGNCLYFLSILFLIITPNTFQAGSSSPVSSISGFSTTSHTEEQSDERDRTDTLTSATINDPFSSFPDPFGKLHPSYQWLIIAMFSSLTLSLSLSFSLGGGFSSSTSEGGAGGGQNSISFDHFGAFKTTSSSNGSSNGGFALFPSVSSSDKQPHPPPAPGTSTATSSSSSSGVKPFAIFPPLNTGTTSTQPSTYKCVMELCCSHYFSTA